MRITFLLSIFFIAELVAAQSAWVRKTDFPGDVTINGREGMTAFSIGNNCFVGTGALKADFWQWNQDSNSWSKKADFPNIREYAVGFAIGQKGYMGTGHASHGWYTNDFWEYDPLTNAWTSKAFVPGGERAFATGFSISGKGYIIGGSENSISSTMYEFDPIANNWTQKSSLPYGKCFSVGFSIGTKGYLAVGSCSAKDELWEWDQLTDTWTKKANFPPGARYYAAGFAIGNKGYVGIGYNDTVSVRDFWEWDQLTNIWTRIEDFPGGATSYAAGFSANGKGYIVGGNGPIKSGLWEYSPKTVSVNEFALSLNANIYPNPNNGEFVIDVMSKSELTEISISNVLGETIYSEKFDNPVKVIKKEINFMAEGNGIYFLKLSSLSG